MKPDTSQQMVSHWSFWQMPSNTCGLSPCCSRVIRSETGLDVPVPPHAEALQAYSMRAGPQLPSFFRSEDWAVALASLLTSRGFAEM